MPIYVFSTLSTFIDCDRWKKNLVRRTTKFSNYKRKTFRPLFKHQVGDEAKSSVFVGRADLSGGNKHTIPFRRQRLDIDEMLPETSSFHRPTNHSLPYVNDPYIIDIVKVTEDRVAELEVQLQEQKRYADEVETKLTNLKYQVRAAIRTFFSLFDRLFYDRSDKFSVYLRQ